MAVNIKICGIRTPEIAMAAIGAGADYIGFVIFPRSPRHVGFDEAAALVKAIDERVPTVAVVVDPDDDLIDQIVKRIGPDYLQLHGDETPERVAAVKLHCGLPLIKAVPIASQADVELAGSYIEIADAILFDAKPAPDAGLPGGNGRPFDWELLAQPNMPRPFGLSGGLTPANVGEAVTVADPDFVDVSSGVESAPGIKDAARIAAFIAAARGAGAKLDAEREEAQQGVAP